MYEDYYVKQSGGAMPVFVGTKRQRGHGIGSMLSGVQKRNVAVSERKRRFVSWKRAEDGRSSVGRCGTGKVVERYGKKRIPEAIKAAARDIDWQTGSGQPERKRRRRRHKDIFSN